MEGSSRFHSSSEIPSCREGGIPKDGHANSLPKERIIGKGRSYVLRAMQQRGSV